MHKLERECKLNGSNVKIRKSVRKWLHFGEIPNFLPDLFLANSMSPDNQAIFVYTCQI